ncbi:MAG: enoyl-[acyl-carrier-protein] reductase FabK [Desulfurella sp.]|uniref:enoyl-[acyl-carrier-protein] reductase FabK n=1 Tax=Desulfurella sp. TaxID=1962857 RepID=UPI003D0ADDD8
MFKTEICDILGIEYPIFQGGMAWVSDAKLASSVSQAGALGIIAAGHATPQWLESQILLAKEMTDKPFGVNIMLLSPYVEEIVRLVIKHKVKVVTTGAGNPGKYMQAFADANIKVIPVVGAVALAKRMESIGAVAVVAEGMESGGHIGELTTMALVPQVVDAVKIPVIAAGGIADGRGFLAALSLGAKGVQIGTRFIASIECQASDNYKQAIIKAKDRDTVVTGLSTGHPVRIIRNKLAREFEKLEKQEASIEEIEKLGSGKLRLAVVDGDVENGSVMAGQISGLVKDIKPVKEIINDIISQAKKTLENLNALGA